MRFTVYSFINRLSLIFSSKRIADFWYKDIFDWKDNFNSSIIVADSDLIKTWGVKDDVSLNDIKKSINYVIATYDTVGDTNSPVLNQLYLDIKEDDAAIRVENIFISEDKQERGFYSNGKVHHGNLTPLFKANLIENSLFDYQKVKVSPSNGVRSDVLYFEYKDEDFRVDIKHKNKISEYNYNFSNLIYAEEFICSSIDFDDLPIIKYKDEFFLFESDIVNSFKIDTEEKRTFGLDLFL